MLTCYHPTPPSVRIRQIQNSSHYQHEFRSHGHSSFLQTATRMRGQAEFLGSSMLSYSYIPTTDSELTAEPYKTQVAFRFGLLVFFLEKVVSYSSGRNFTDVQEGNIANTSTREFHWNTRYASVNEQWGLFKHLCYVVNSVSAVQGWRPLKVIEEQMWEKMTNPTHICNTPWFAMIYDTYPERWLLTWQHRYQYHRCINLHLSFRGHG